MTTFGYGSAERRRRPRVRVGVPDRHELLEPGRGDDRSTCSRRKAARDKLKGKKIVHLYHDSAFGKEPIPVFDALARRSSASSSPRSPVAHPGNTQESQWLQIRQIKPDYVILWGWGVMNPTALKAAAKIGFPREKMLGVWWAGSEEDVIPAGDAAKGYVTAAFTRAGHELPGDAGHPEEGLRRRQGQPRGQVAPGLDLPHARRRLRHHHRRGHPQGAGEVRQGQGDDGRAGPLGPREPQPRPRRASRSWAPPACSRRSRRAASTTRAPARSVPAGTARRSSR